MLSGAIETAKQVAEAVREFDKIELREKAIQLVGQVEALTGENVTLKAKIRELEDYAATKATLVFRDSAYWVGDTSAKPFAPSDGPFCSKCFDRHDGLVRLHCGHGSFLDGNAFICPNCKTTAVHVMPATTVALYGCCGAAR
jgi:hypothetical protein